MAITMNPGKIPSLPKIPTLDLSNPKDQENKIKKLEQDKKRVLDIEKQIEKSIKNVNKKMEETFEKSAKLICLLRLDMVSDRLDKINPKWAHQIDEIANALESEN